MSYVTVSVILSDYSIDITLKWHSPTHRTHINVARINVHYFCAEFYNIYEILQLKKQFAIRKLAHLLDQHVKLDQLIKRLTETTLASQTGRFTVLAISKDMQNKIVEY